MSECNRQKNAPPPPPPCILCHNVLPPGEHCRACGRVNDHPYLTT